MFKHYLDTNRQHTRNIGSFQSRLNDLDVLADNWGNIGDQNSNEFLEAKEAIINKLPFDDDKKFEIQKLVDKYPQKASKVPWQKKDLGYAEIMDILGEISGKQIKQGNISGLVEGKDYVDLTSKFPNYPRIKVYIPLCYKASKVLANKKIGGAEGAWCIAYQKNNAYWFNYIAEKMLLPVFVIREALINDMSTEKEFPKTEFQQPNKFAVMIPPPYADANFEIWNHNNSKISIGNFSDRTGLDFKEIEKAINSYGRPKIEKLISSHPDNRIYFDKDFLAKKLEQHVHKMKNYGEFYTYFGNYEPSLKTLTFKQIKDFVSNSDLLDSFHDDWLHNIDAYGYNHPEHFLKLEKKDYTDEEREEAQDQYELGMWSDQINDFVTELRHLGTPDYIRREQGKDAEDVYWEIIKKYSKIFIPHICKEIIKSESTLSIIEFMNESQEE